MPGLDCSIVSHLTLVTHNVRSGGMEALTRWGTVM